MNFGEVLAENNGCYFFLTPSIFRIAFAIPPHFSRSQSPASCSSSRKYPQLCQEANCCDWIPAFAGMTVCVFCHSSEGWNPSENQEQKTFSETCRSDFQRRLHVLGRAKLPLSLCGTRVRQEAHPPECSKSLLELA